ncbi:MAG: CPBP family intramembrane metalloprotease [Chloroflexota bacterium]|nr:MAG: CPBP family intramembrane metalloprotease [Chloroflexota bacterium]
MNRYIGLYIIALAGLVGGENLSQLSFLTPLSLAILLFGTLGLWRLDDRPFRALGFPKGARWPLQLVLSILAGVGIVLLFLAIVAVTNSATITAKGEITGSLPPLIFRTLVWTALIAASEELIFRGGYFQVLSGRTTIIVGAITSAALWAIFHLPAMNADDVLIYQLVFGLLTFTAFGTALALAAVLAGGSLWVPIGIHYGYNLAFSAFGALFSTEISGPPYLTGAPNWSPETGIMGVIVWTIVAAILYWQFRRRTAAAG